MQSENSSNNTNFENDEISLKEIVSKIKIWYRYLLTKWLIVIVISITGALLGLTYAYRQPVTYTAILTFVLEDDKGGGGMSGAVGGLANQFGIELGGGGTGVFAGGNLIELMKSRLLVEKTLLNPIEVDGKFISIAEYYISLNKMRESWNENNILTGIKFLPHPDRTKFTIQQDSILYCIYSELMDSKFFNISQKSKMISFTSIEVTSKYEKFAKIFCENLAKETSKFYIEIKTKKSQQNVDVLQKQLDSLQSKLKYNALGAWGFEKVNLQVNSAILTQITTNLELSKLSLRKETPLIQIIDPPIYPLQKNKISKIKHLIFGGFISFFLVILYLVFIKKFKILIF